MTHKTVLDEKAIIEPTFEVGDILHFNDNYIVMVVDKTPKNNKNFMAVILHVVIGYNVTGCVVECKKADYKVFDGTLSFKRI